MVPVIDTDGNKCLESRLEGHVLDTQEWGAVGSRNGIGDGLKGKVHFI